MKFEYKNESWDVIRATEEPYAKTSDCRLPYRSAARLVEQIKSINPTKIELLGIRASRDFVGHLHRYWGFRLIGQDGKAHLVEILHMRDMSVYNKVTGRGSLRKHKTW